MRRLAEGSAACDNLQERIKFDKLKAPKFILDFLSFRCEEDCAAPLRRRFITQRAHT